MPTQNVNLTETLDNFVTKQIAGGHFNNASEVHRAALSQMARQEEERSSRLKKLRQDIQTGDEDITAGQVTEYNHANALLADIIQ